MFNILKLSIYTVLSFGMTLAYADGSSCEKKACDADITKEQRQCVLKKFCKAKTKIVTVEKIVEKVVEVPVTVVKTKKIVRKNIISLLGGVGPKGNLRENFIPNGHEVTTDNGLVVGLQYTRDLYQFKNDNMAITGSIQVQTNRTALVGVGVEF
jgi:hypothetical protein